MGQGCSEFGIEEAQRLLDEDWRQRSAFRVDPKIAEIIGVGEGTTSQPVPRCPRCCRSCALHRIGVQLTQRKGDDVSHDGSLFSLFPRTGLMPEGAGAPLLLPELARSSGGEGGKGTSRRGITRPQGRRKIHLERIRVDPAQSEIKASGGRTGRPIFPLQGRGGSAPFPH